MYSLIKFDNQECLVTLSKKVKIIEGKDCLVKVKGSSYECCLLNTDGTLILIIYKYNLLDKFYSKYSLGTDDCLFCILIIFIIIITISKYFTYILISNFNY